MYNCFLRNSIRRRRYLWSRRRRIHVHKKEETYIETTGLEKNLFWREREGKQWRVSVCVVYIHIYVRLQTSNSRISLACFFSPSLSLVFSPSHSLALFLCLSLPLSLSLILSRSLSRQVRSHICKHSKF